MTPADKLKELREALEGATPGPDLFWVYGHVARWEGHLDDARAVVALMNAAPALLAIAEGAVELFAEAASETRYGARVKLREGLGRLLDHS